MLVAIGLPDGATAVIHDNALSRTDGNPPLVAVKGGSAALLSVISIRGGGVAGVLIDGNVTLINNRFEGKGPGQGSKIWIWNGSTATVSRNKFDGYRNAVNAAGSRVMINENEVRGFEKTAMIVKQSSHAAHVFGNTAYSNEKSDKAISVEGLAGVVSGNDLHPDQ